MYPLYWTTSKEGIFMQGREINRNVVIYIRFRLIF
jgi:hypothetical protein